MLLISGRQAYRLKGTMCAKALNGISLSAFRTVLGGARAQRGNGCLAVSCRPVSLSLGSSLRAETCLGGALTKDLRQRTREWVGISTVACRFLCDWSLDGTVLQRGRHNLSGITQSAAGMIWELLLHNRTSNHGRANAGQTGSMRYDKRRRELRESRDHSKIVFGIWTVNPNDRCYPDLRLSDGRRSCWKEPPRYKGTAEDRRRGVANDFEPGPLFSPNFLK